MVPLVSHRVEKAGLSLSEKKKKDKKIQNQKKQRVGNAYYRHRHHGIMASWHHLLRLPRGEICAKRVDLCTLCEDASMFLLVCFVCFFTLEDDVWLVSTAESLTQTTR